MKFHFTIPLLVAAFVSATTATKALAKAGDPPAPGSYIIRNRLVQISYGYFPNLGDTQVTWVSDDGKKFSTVQLLESPRWAPTEYNVFLIRTDTPRGRAPIRISIQLVTGIEDAYNPGNSNANLFLLNDLPAEQGVMSSQLDARRGDRFVTLTDLPEYLRERTRDSIGARIDAQGALLSLWKRDRSKTVELAKILAAVPGAISREDYHATLDALTAEPPTEPAAHALREALESSQIPRPDTNAAWVRRVTSQYNCLQLLTTGPSEKP